MLIDASEIRVCRPEKKQHLNYSGKKKCHTAKVQIAMSATGGILRLDYATYGRTHDFHLFKSSYCNLKKAKLILAVSGCQGITKLYPQAQTAIKSGKKHQLSQEEKAFNRLLSSQRMRVENTLAKFKAFKVLSFLYRNHRKRLGLRLNLIAGMINIELGVLVSQEVYYKNTQNINQCSIFQAA